MPGVPFPLFGGGLGESWEIHQTRLLSWLRANSVPQDEDGVRIDYLLLSLRPGSSPLNWFVAQPARSSSSFNECLVVLGNKYGGGLRKEMMRLSALNALEVRSFRDSDHKTEMVLDLVNDLDYLMSLASVIDDNQRREHLLRCFRGFNGALKMMNKAASFDGAVLAALSWESSVISKPDRKRAQETVARPNPRRAPPQGFLQRQPREHHSKSQCNLAPSHWAAPISTTATTPAHHPPPTLRADPDHLPGTQPPLAGNPSPEQDVPDEAFPSLGPLYSALTHTKANPAAAASNCPHDQPIKQVQNQAGPSYFPGRIPIPRKDSDPEHMMESFVDPHFVPVGLSEKPPEEPRSNLWRPRQSQEVLQGVSPAFEQGLEVKPARKPWFKPLVYDPRTNPYPPPEPIPQSGGADIPRPASEHPNSTALRNHPRGLPSHDVVPSLVRVSDWLNSSNRANTTEGAIVNPRESPPLLFPSPRLRGFPATSSADLRPWSALERYPQVTVPPEGPDAAPFSQTPYQARISHLNSVNLNPQTVDHGSGLDRRPSKLVKQRRASQGSSINNSSAEGRSVGTRSLDRLRALVGSATRRSSRGSVSREQPDSIQDCVPHSPNQEAGARKGASGGEWNQKLRPMQAQFYRLFRKHNTSEIARHERRMMLRKSMPARASNPMHDADEPDNFRRGHARRQSKDPSPQPILGMGSGDRLLPLEGIPNLTTASAEQPGAPLTLPHPVTRQFQATAPRRGSLELGKAEQQASAPQGKLSWQRAFA